VEVVSHWAPDAESKEEVLVGYVSGVGGGRGVACCDGEEVSFPSDAVVSFSGYRLHVNDWIKVSVERGRERGRDRREEGGGSEGKE
jgi:hypothetical protein